MTIAEEVLDTHLALIDKLKHSPQLRAMVNNAAKEVGLPHEDVKLAPFPDRAEQRKVAAAATAAGLPPILQAEEAGFRPSAATSLGLTLSHADTFRIRQSTVEQIHNVAESHPDDLTTSAYTPPEPAGVAVLDTPLWTPDRRGNDQYTHVIAWVPLAGIINGEAQFGYMVLLLNDINRKPDFYSLQILEDGKQHQPLGEALAKAGHLFPIQFVYYLPDSPAGRLWVDYDSNTSPTGKPLIALSMGRLLMALWDLISRVPPAKESGLKPGEVPLRRTTARRARRTLANPRVREVPLHSPCYLPREPGESTGRTRAAPDHRVKVRKHERMQPYGPGRTLRKKITILAYEYGPEDPADVEPPKRVYRA